MSKCFKAGRDGNESSGHVVLRLTLGDQKGTNLPFLGDRSCFAEYMHRLSMTIMLLLQCEHRWFSGRMLACHAGGPGSIPGRCSTTFLSSSPSAIHSFHLILCGGEGKEGGGHWPKVAVTSSQRWTELVLAVSTKPGQPAWNILLGAS